MKETRDSGSERLPSRPITGAVAGVAPAADDTLRLRLVWLLAFRAIVVTVLLVTAVALRLTSEEQLFARAAVALYGAGALAYATILFGAVWLRLTGKRHIIAIAYVQLIADAGIGTVLVAVTGGVESIFVFLYSLTVLNAAIVVARRGAIAIAAVSAVLYGLVLLVQALGGDQSLLTLLPSFLTNSASFFLVAVLGGYLTAQLTSTSERLQSAQAEIERLEQLYAAVLGSLPSGVISVDPFGKVVYVNGAGVEILGKDLVGRSLTDRADFLQDLLHDRHDRFEVEVPVPNRGTRFIGGSVAPLIGVEHAGSVVVFQDLTELRRLQTEVGRAERMAELGRLAAGLAHEVRNPLAAMIGCLELLKSDAPKLGDEGGRMLGIVHREAERLSTLVGEFLTYARPAPAKTDALDVNVFFAEILSMARNGLRAVDVTRDAAANGPLVACDGAQLKQVLWNLVLNADAMVASQARRGRVHLSIADDGDFANICVDDDGPGVAVEMRDRIFEPFFTTRPDGNGLGLATCAQLIRQNAGQIRVEPSVLGGARFVVRLPVKRVLMGAVV